VSDSTASARGPTDGSHVTPPVRHRPRGSVRLPEPLRPPETAGALFLRVEAAEARGGGEVEVL